MKKQNTFTKKAITVLLSLAMVLTMIPVNAFAAEEDQTVMADETENAVENAVAEVTASDGTVIGQYDSLNAAITAAQDSDGSTVKLLADTTVTSKLGDANMGITKGHYTVDLNGKTVTTTSAYCFYFNDSSVNVTIKNGTLAGKDSIHVVTVFQAAAVTLENVTATASLYPVCVMGGTVTIYGGECGTVDKKNGIYVDKGTTVKLYGGTYHAIWTHYEENNLDYSSLLPAGYIFMQKDDSGEYTKYIDPGTMGTNSDEKTKNVYHIQVVKCTHSGGLDTDGKCPRCGLAHEHTAPNAKGQCETCSQRIVAQSGAQYYTDLSGAIAAANGAEITLLQVFGENVTVEDGAAASILLGNGGTVEGEGTYPYYWMAMNHGIPLTMNGGSITLKDGTMGQGKNGADGRTAVALEGGTLIVESSVTTIAGGTNGLQQPAIEATGGTLDLQGNTKLEGGLSMSGDAALAHKLTAGIFTNSANGSVSVDGHNTYSSVFDLLETGYAFAKYNADGTTGAAVDKDTSVTTLTEDVIVIACTHKDAKGGNLFVKGTCSRCGLTCTKHKYGADTKSCETCGQELVANDDDNNSYVSLNEAFAQVESGRTISAVAKLPEESLTFGNNKTVTLNLNNWPVTGNAADTAALTVESGKLTIINGIEGSMNMNEHAVITNKGKGFAVSLTGGKLEFGGKAFITGGLQVIDGGGLEGGLKEGSILIKGSGTQMGESAYSVSVRDHANNANYGTVLGLLAPGCAFAKYNNTTGEIGDLVNGNDVSLTEDVIVVAHPAHDMKLDSASGKYVCACGFVCEHNQGFTDGKCDICGAACTHPSGKVIKSGGTTTCGVCKTQMVVKVEKDGTTTYYAERRNSSNDETLWYLFNNNLESGSTVTLLADDLFAWAYVSQGKTITLNLNGKKLTESIQGITVGQGDQNDTSTDNKLIVKGTLGEGETSENGNYAFRTWEGGELDLEDFKGGGRIGGIIADGGKVTTGVSNTDIKIGTLDINNNKTELSFRTGTFDKIMSNAGKKLGDLLGLQSSGIHTGYAFRYTTGDKAFVPYHTEITSSNVIENVTVTGCDHSSMTGRTCDYCGMENIVAMRINSNGSKATYAADSADEATINEKVCAAFYSWNNNGGKLRLFTDATLNDITIKNKYATVIDLNGHRITGGTMTLANGMNLTITDESTGRNGSFANVTVNAGASLTVDSGISVGKITASDKTAKITLKEGSRFTGYDRLWGMALMDWVEDGYCIKDGDNYKDLSAVDSHSQSGTAKSGSYMITKAPATINASNRTGEIEHGAKVSASFLPTITNTSGTSPDYYFIQWYRRTENDVLSLGDGTLRDGTFTYGGTKPLFKGVNVGDTLDVFCTIKAYKDDGSQLDTLLWQTAVKDYKLTVTKGKAAVTIVPTAIADLSYTGSAQDLITDTGKADGGTMQYSLDGTTYSADIPQGTEAKEYTVWYKAVGDSNHDDSEPQSMKVKIAPMLLSDLPYQDGKQLVITKKYDGTAKVLIQIDGFVKNGGVLSNADDRIALKQGTDFTVVDAKYDNADAGEDKTASMSFKMKNTNYVFACSDPNYTDFYASITKLSSDGLTKHNGSFTVSNHTTAVYTYGLSQLLPELPDPCSYGDLSYTARWNAEVGSVYKVKDSDISIKDGVLTLKIDAADTADADGSMKVGSITVTVSSTNYEDFDLTITVDAADLKLPLGEPTMSANTLTYGDTLSKIMLSGTMKDGDTAVKGTFAWSNPDAKVGPAGDYAAAWTFTPADTATYAKMTGVAKIKVQKAAVTGAPDYTPVTTDGQTLADANLTADAQNGESLFKVFGKAVEGSVKWVDSKDKTTELDSTAKVEQGKAYTWLFTPTDSANYNTLTGTITLWPQSTGGGGTSISGGGGGGATPAIPGGDGTVTPDNDVVTEKDSKSGIATRTTIEETKTQTTKNEQGQTVSKTIAAVSKELAEELVKQALDHKSDAVEITVTSTAADIAPGSAKSTELAIPKSAIEEIVAKTDADLVIKTDSGEVVLDNKTLQTIAKVTKGDTVTITVSENTKLTKAQKAAKDIVGKNGKVFDLVVSIGGKLIHDFDGGKAYVTLPMPEKLKGKDIVVIYISDKGFCEILNHTVTTVGTDSYINFTTSHFSTFAVAEKSVAENLIQAQNKASVKKLMKSAKFQVKTKETSKKSVKITVTPKNNKSLISDIQSMGYTVKYRFYRSTKKNSGYKLLKTTKANAYTNTTGKKGKKYYYKVRVLVYDGKKLIAESELKQASCATKIWTK